MTPGAAAQWAGVRRVLVSSTSGTVAVSRTPEPVPDESFPYALDLCAGWPYYLSKIYQEKLVLQQCREANIPLVVLNSSVSANSIARKCSSPLRRKISRTSIPALRSISLSKSRNCLPSCFAAAFPIVVFPTPGSPTRIKCGAEVLTSLSFTQ